jgi:hypothetical protein
VRCDDSFVGDSLNSPAQFPSSERHSVLDHTDTDVAFSICSLSECPGKSAGSMVENDSFPAGGAYISNMKRLMPLHCNIASNMEQRIKARQTTYG